MCRVGTRAASPSAFPALYRGDDATGVETLGYEPWSQNPNVRVWVFTVDEKYSSRHAGVKELTETKIRTQTAPTAVWFGRRIGLE